MALATVALCGAVVAPALAGKPTITRMTIDETFDDEFLTAECGVPVETRVSGHQITRSFTDSSGRLIEVFTLNLTITPSSTSGTFRLKDVGADVTRISKDGVVHQVIGQVPFFFNGTTWEDPTTGEVLKSPTGPDVFLRQLEKACAALAP